MKDTKKIVLFMIVLFFSLVLLPNFVHADTSVSNEEDLRDTIDNSTDGEIIKLSSNIVLTEPIEIVDKDITIDGNGLVITRAADGWRADERNNTLITAGQKDTKLNLMNLKVIASEMYGIQSYSGAYVSLDNVTISDCGHGGVLVNAGTVEIKNLILNRNGSVNNNGIEIAKGTGIYEEGVMPKLIMNGSISSTETDGVIYLAIDDDLATFEVSNSPTSQDKIYVSGKTIVVTDANNNIKFQSNENAKSGIKLEGEQYIPNTENPEAGLEPQSITNSDSDVPSDSSSNSNGVPKTGDNAIFGLSIFMIVVSSLAIIALNKK